MPSRAELALDVWHRLARQEQQAPDGDWRIWAVLGGRGSGKTRTGAEWLVKAAVTTPADWAVVAPTYGDARKTCVEGPSGILKVAGPLVSKYNRSSGEIWLADSYIRMDGADDGALRIQGSNLAGAWCDEVGLWRDWETAWNESLAFAVRIDPARICATGTPKAGHPLVKMLLEQADNVSRMHTFDNAPNLSKVALAELEARYAGTRLGRQELEGEYLDDVEGALWSAQLIDAARLSAHVDLPGGRIVVGIDPSGGAAECGIVAALATRKCPCRQDGLHFLVIDDATVAGSGDLWAKAAGACWERWSADRCVAEVNFGGDMVRTIMAATVPHVPVDEVRTGTRDKKARAEPVAALYEQGRVHHVGHLGSLEAEMTSWVPYEPGQPSPNRIDAMVWAVGWLLDREAKAPARLLGPSPGLRVPTVRR